MEELRAVAEVVDAGGNAALILCGLYIYRSAQAYNRVAERLARIEKALKIEPSDEKGE
jgi:hypothetical protein